MPNHTLPSIQGAKDVAKRSPEGSVALGWGRGSFGGPSGSPIANGSEAENRGDDRPIVRMRKAMAMRAPTAAPTGSAHRHMGW